MNNTHTQTFQYCKYFKKLILLHLIFCVASFNLFAMNYNATESGPWSSNSNLAAVELPPVETCESCALPGVTPETFIVGAHAIIYGGRIYDADECVTLFFYCIVNDGGSGGADISHTDFGDMDCESTCLEDESLTTMGEWSIDNNGNLDLDNACGTVEYGTDPTTGVCGVKHDEEAEGGCYSNEDCSGDNYEVTHLYLSVEGNVPEATMVVAIKYGNTFTTVEIPGPGECESSPCDDAPVAENDSITTLMDTPVVGMSQTNDTMSADGGNVWSLIGPDGGAAHGTVTMDPNGTYTYIPDSSYTGTDVFIYELCDIDGDCDQATVTVTILTTGEILHVQLISFSAIKNGETSLLKWATASETNNDYFEIQRSYDSKNFTTIGKVEGSGTSNSVISYQFTDRSPITGANYYRLKQVDFDGRATLSQVRMVSFNKTNAISIFPNPTTTELAISLNSWDPNYITTFKVLDFNGAEVLSQQVSSETTRLNVAHLPVGTYFIQITNYTTSDTYRFIKS